MFTKLKLDEIQADPSQPRQEFDPNELDRLSNSIRQFGIINPIVVEKTKDGYLLVDGERRFRAANKVKLKEVPVIVVDSKNEVDRQVKRFHLQEQHVSWSSFDKARSIEKLQRETGMDTRELSSMLGLATSTVNGYLQLLNLSTRTKQLAVEKRIPFSYLVKIGQATKKLDDVGDQRKLEAALIQRIENGEITKTMDIPKYSVAIQHGGRKVFDAVLGRRNYSAKQALRDAKADSVIYHRNLSTNFNWLKVTIQRAIEAGAYKHATDASITTVKRVISKLEEYQSLSKDNLE